MVVVFKAREYSLRMNGNPNWTHPLWTCKEQTFWSSGKLTFSRLQLLVYFSSQRKLLLYFFMHSLYQGCSQRRFHDHRLDRTRIVKCERSHDHKLDRTIIVKCEYSWGGIENYKAYVAWIDAIILSSQSQTITIRLFWVSACTRSRNVLPPFLNISLFRDSYTDYIRSKMSGSTL